MKQIGFTILALAMLWCIQGTEWLVAQQLVLKSYDRSSGLASDYVMTMCQDRDGFIWFGTDRGLSCYNGKSFTTFTTNDGLPDNFVTHIYQDSKGYLWFSVFEHGLVRFDGATMQTYSSKNGYPIDNIGGMAEDRYGRLYITAASGLFVLSNDKLFFLRTLGHYSSITALPGGKILFSDEDTLFRIDPTEHEFTTYRRIKCDKYGPIYTIGTFQHASRSLHDGEVYSGSNGEVIVLKFQNDTLLKPVARYTLNGRFLSIVHEGDSVLWCGSTSDGIFRIEADRVTGYGRRNGLQQQRVESLIRDYEGNLWLSVFGSGVQKLSVTSVVVYQQTDGLRENYVSSVFEDSRRRMWFGTGTGLAVLEHDSIRYAAVKEPEMKEIRVIREDNAGRFYIGTFEHLFGPASYEQLIRNQPLRKTRIGYGVSGIIPVHDSLLNHKNLRSVWVSTYGEGVTRLTGNDSVMYRIADGLSSDNIEQALPGNKAMWFLSRGKGATRLSNGHFEIYSTDRGLPSASIFSLYEDTPSGHPGVWFGTDRGLTLLHNGQATTLTERDGILGMPVLGIFPDRQTPSADGQTLWIITPKALHRVKQGRVHLIGTFTFSQKELLSVNDLLISLDNYLWCATPNGVYRISLSTFHRMSVNPKVAITSVMQDTVRLFKHTGTGAGNHELELNYTQNNIMIEYAGLSFVSESDLTYMYQLEPTERSWSQPSPDNHIQLRNLESGDYRFRVAAVSADGLISAKPAVFTFRILPPFWKRWWFLALSGILLSGLAVAIIRYIVQRKLRIQAREFERRQTLQQERDRISRDLHDNVGAQLVNIISGLELAGRYSDSQYGEIKKILSSLNEDTRVTMALLRETIWALHTPGMSVEKFAQELDNYVRKQLRYHPGSILQFHVEGNTNAALRPVEAMNLLRVIQEALSNSLKHGSPTTIIIRLHLLNDNLLHVYFWNDGCFEKNNEDLSGGKGIPNMERRIGELGGTFHFHKSDDRTASVELSIPLAKE